MSNEKNIILHEEYISRINKVQDYIEINISQEFSLKELSKIANFSPYHFHRIFSTITAETLFQYIQRTRLEKAAFLLLTDGKVSITEIALKCGFSNQASFAKAFKNYFNMSASKFKQKVYAEKKYDFYSESNMRKVFNEIVCYNNDVRNKRCLEGPKIVDIPYSVELKVIPSMEVVYVRHTGSYKKNSKLFENLFHKLYNWADKKKLIDTKETKWLTLCHDIPDITDENKLRVSVCMTIKDKVQVDGEIGKMQIPGGKYAVGHFELNEDQYQEAWNAMFSEWLPCSGYQPDDSLAFELYLNSDLDDSNKRKVDIYIPVKKL